jgi:hypothetical protein
MAHIAFQNDKLIYHLLKEPALLIPKPKQQKGRNVWLIRQGKGVIMMASNGVLLTEGTVGKFTFSGKKTLWVLSCGDDKQPQFTVRSLLERETLSPIWHGSPYQVVKDLKSFFNVKGNVSPADVFAYAQGQGKVDWRQLDLSEASCFQCGEQDTANKQNWYYGQQLDRLCRFCWRQEHTQQARTAQIELEEQEKEEDEEDEDEEDEDEEDKEDEEDEKDEEDDKEEEVTVRNANATMLKDLTQMDPFMFSFAILNTGGTYKYVSRLFTVAGLYIPTSRTEFYKHQSVICPQVANERNELLNAHLTSAVQAGIAIII